MTRINLFLRLVRWPNLLVVAATMLLMRYGIVQPILHVYHIGLVLPTVLFLLLLLSVLLIAAAGYLINDYFDVEVDRINRPSEVIIGKHISEEGALTAYYWLNGTALALDALVCWQVHQFSLVLIFPVTMGLLYFYSTTYKRQLLVGNVLVSLVTATVPLLVPAFDIPPVYRFYQTFFVQTSQNLNIIFVYVMIYAGFAFLVNMARELVKDAEDFEGDVATGRNTLPAAAGLLTTRLMVVGLLLVTFAGLAYLYTVYLSREVIETVVDGNPVQLVHFDRITGVYFLLLLALPLLTAMAGMLMARKRIHYTRIAGLLKWIMVAGIGYAIVIRFKLM